MDEVVGIQATRALLRENAPLARCMYIQLKVKVRPHHDAWLETIINLRELVELLSSLPLRVDGEGPFGGA